MKTLLFAATLSLLTAAAPDGLAQSKTPPAADTKVAAVVTTSKPDAHLVARTNRLTDKMVRQLALNNYQSNRLRAINRDKVAKMMAVEQRYATDPKKIEDDCQGLCQERDRELRNVLSTEQYNTYYEYRADFYTYDKEFLAQTAAPAAGYTIPGAAAPVETKETAEQTTIQSKGQ